MAIQHTPLDSATLGPEAQKIFSSAPAKMMAARGMAPIADAGVLVSVLYQLSIDNDEKIRKAAVKSSSELPHNILAGGLQANIDPRVLDFYARELRGKDELLELIVLNHGTHAETIAMIAGRSSDKIVDLISANEQRMLEFPQIISAMYTNRQARMSTVDRAVELAVRNKVKVPGIAAWDEICRALLESGKSEQSDAEKDAMFAQAARVNINRAGEAGEEEQRTEGPATIRDLSVPMKIRLATLGNSFDRSVLIRDPKRVVAVSAIKAPGVTDAEAAKYAGNTSLADDVIAYIATRKDWTKLYSVKLSLCQNPKCPLPSSMKMMPHLREKDIRVLARSKGIPSAVAAQAKKLLMQRKSPNDNRRGGAGKRGGGGRGPQRGGR